VGSEREGVRQVPEEGTKLSKEQQHAFASALARYMRGRDQG
jgi:hypothetical protein